MQRISDLIQFLQDRIELHGDLEVRHYNDYWGYVEPLNTDMLNIMQFEESWKEYDCINVGEKYFVIHCSC